MPKIITNYLELIADLETPVSIYNKVSVIYKDTFLFESILGGEQIGRYSFVGFNSLKIIEANAKENSFNKLSEEIERYSDLEENKTLPFFHKGFVGFFSFESIADFETSLKLQNSNFPKMFAILVGNLIVIDHVKQKLFIIDNRFDHDDNKKSKKQLDYIFSLINQPCSLNRLFYDSKHHLKNFEESGFTLSTTHDDYVAIVNQGKKHIKEGDVFQIVLSHKFTKKTQVDVLNVYRLLRSINPSPYLFIFNFKNTTLVGSSPEMVVKSTRGSKPNEIEAQIRPIAGTYRKTQDPIEDEKLKEKLLKDPKEIAEHIMLIDLARNDLGRVCQTGSIKIPQKLVVENYSHVMHIVSSVKGVLQLDKASKIVDLLKAVFPAGTLSGTPKVEAIKLISQLEKKTRGFYGGAIGYFGLDGLIDTAIMIRTIMITGDNIEIQAGSGIVADSDPEKEWQETFNKANALIEVVNLAEHIK